MEEQLYSNIQTGQEEESLKVSPEFASNLKYDLRRSFIKETLPLSGKGRCYTSLTERDSTKTREFLDPSNHTISSPDQRSPSF